MKHCNSDTSEWRWHFSWNKETKFFRFDSMQYDWFYTSISHIPTYNMSQANSYKYEYNPYARPADCEWSHLVHAHNWNAKSGARQKKKWNFRSTLVWRIIQYNSIPLKNLIFTSICIEIKIWSFYPFYRRIFPPHNGWLEPEEWIIMISIVCGMSAECKAYTRCEWMRRPNIIHFKYPIQFFLPEFY